MQVEISPYELQIILRWCESSSEGIFGSLGGIATLRTITLADRLSSLLAAGRGRQPEPDGPQAGAIRRAEETAAAVVREVAESAVPELTRRGYEVAYAGIVHALPRDDPRYWSVVDLQIEPVGAERPEYRFLSDEVPVWRDGQPCIGEEGAELRQRVDQVLEDWFSRLPIAPT